MKKKIKINFKFFGPIDLEDNFLTNVLRKNYDIVICDEPDYLFYSVYDTNPPLKNIEILGKIIKTFSPTLYIYLRKLFSRTYSFFSKKQKIDNKENIVKIFWGLENIRPNMDECDWAFSTYFEDEINNPRYMRLPMYITNNSGLKNFGMPQVDRKVNIKKIIKEKTKFCNFIYSQDISSRNNFFKKLSEYKKIDSPGRCMTNMLPLSHESPKKSRLSSNWVSEKIKFLKKYKFTIAFENSFESGGVSEKLIHPMLVDSIPIYFGSENIKKEFNTKSFINFNDFKNMNEFIRHIIKVDKDDKLYEEYLKQSWYLPGKSPRYVDDKFILKRFKEIFG